MMTTNVISLVRMRKVSENCKYLAIANFNITSFEQAQKILVKVAQKVERKVAEISQSWLGKVERA